MRIYRPNILLVVLGALVWAVALIPSPAEAAFAVDDAIPITARPRSIAVNEVTHRAYVFNEADSSVNSVVTVISTIAPYGVIGVIPVGRGGATNIEVNPVTNKVYVANSVSSSISVIDGPCNCVVATLPVLGSPRGIAIDTVHNRLYAAADDQWVHAFTLDNGPSYISLSCTATTVSPSRDMQDLAVNPANQRVYVSMGFVGGRGLLISGTSCGILADLIPNCGNNILDSMTDRA